MSQWHFMYASEGSNHLLNCTLNLAVMALKFSLSSLKSCFSVCRPGIKLVCPTEIFIGKGLRRDKCYVNIQWFDLCFSLSLKKHCDFWTWFGLTSTILISFLWVNRELHKRLGSWAVCRVKRLSPQPPKVLILLWDPRVLLHLDNKNHARFIKNIDKALCYIYLFSSLYKLDVEA